MDKVELLENVKREAKKLIGEAVSKKFIHTDSNLVTSLCGAVDCCVTHKLKKRVGGLFPPTNDSFDVLVKLSKLCSTAASVLRMATHMSHIHQSKGRFSPEVELNSPEKRRLNGYSGFCTKFLWIRLALLERLLTTIVGSLVEHANEFYEPDALLSDPVNGPSLVWLLDGPCSLDFSRMKTPDITWNDPTAHELVQRHRIYSSPVTSNTLKSPSSTKRSLFTTPYFDEKPMIGTPIMAREHVESLHQNADTTLLYGKNNVIVATMDEESSLQGYLSLHKSADDLFLKWTPNPMLHTSSFQSIDDKCKYWDHAVTTDLSDIVYLHCHSLGASNGNLVLINQDGTQLPPLTFQSDASLFSFLSCLEQGLYPLGRLDPPLFKQGHNLTWPKLKKLLPNKLKGGNDVLVAGNDHVFRLVFRSSANTDESNFKKKLTTSPNIFLKPWRKTPQEKRILLPKVYCSMRVGSGRTVLPRVVLSLACEKMKHQILARAFNGWLASYRHLKTVRTHLASLVLPWSGDFTESKQGLTKEIWESMKKRGLMFCKTELRRLVYLGGIQSDIRKEVWPYILGHYTFALQDNLIDVYDKIVKENYATILNECKVVERHLQENERELLALNGFANGETFFHHEIQSDAKSSLNDTLSSDNFTDNLDSISNDIKMPVEPNSDNNNEFSVIASILETKHSLREMVQKASKKGVLAWKNIIKKKGRNFKDSQNQFEGLHQKFVPKTQSFNIAQACCVCGKELDVDGSSFHDILDKIDDSIKCYSCLKLVEETDLNNDSSEMIDDQSQSNRNDVVNENGEDIPIEKKHSVTSIGSNYSDDYLKDFALNIHRIDKDVLRCDRTNPFFSSEANLEKLRNIIMCYVWERLNIGYIQGMCDLCAPLLVILDDEAKVYGCFVKLMDRIGGNFPHGEKMDLHLSNLASLVQILDPELYEVFDVHEDESIFYFAYRWLLLDFKRELLYEDIFLVWETIWSAASVSSENFSLFFALALIELYREIIIDNKMDFTDIIKFFNEMAEQHDAHAALNLARNIVRKLQELMNPGEIESNSVESTVHVNS